MAGIGFELRGAVARDARLGERLRAWTTAGLVSSGPWLVTVAVLVFLHLFAPERASSADYASFRGIVTYTFAFSLLVVGVGQMAVTRQLADQLWLGQHDRVLPGYVASLAAVGVVQVVLGTAAVVGLGLGRTVGVLVVALYVVASWTWVGLVWLGAIRDHASVLRAYGTGAAVTVLAALGAGACGADGLAGLLAVFTAGQAVTCVLLAAPIVRGVQPSARRGAEALSGLWRHGSLVALGVLYGLGLWADKFVFWLVDGLPLDGLGPLRHHPLYDTCSFLAHATVVPALALHLVRTETGFYERYRDFYGAVSAGPSGGRGGTLREIEAARARMLATLRASTVRLIRVQGWFTLGAIVLAPHVLPRLGLPEAAVPVFRVLAVGAYLQVLFLLTLLVLLYFDLRKRALAAAAVFLGLGTLLPWLAASGPPGTYGVGYALAALGALLVAFLGLQRDLARLLPLTFARELRRN